MTDSVLPGAPPDQRYRACAPAQEAAPLGIFSRSIFFYCGRGADLLVIAKQTLARHDIMTKKLAESDWVTTERVARDLLAPGMELVEGLADEELEAVALDRYRRLRQEPMRGPNPHVYGLVLTSAQRAAILLRASPLVTDGAGMARLAGELVHAGANGSFEALEPPVAHGEFLEWRTIAAMAPPEDEELPKIPADELDLRLPWEGEGQEAQGFSPGSLDLVVGSEMRAALEQVTEERGVSVEATLLTLWMYLLSRYGNSDTATVQVTFDLRRRHAELARFVGPAWSRFAVTASPAVAPDLGAAAVRVAQTIDALQRSQLQLEGAGGNRASLAPALAAGSGLSFEYIHVPAAGLPKGSQVNVDSYPIADRLRLQCSDDGAQVRCILHYDSSRLPRRLVESMLGTFEQLVAGACHRNRPGWSEIELVSLAQRSHLLALGSSPDDVSPPQKTLSQLFAEQVERTPDRVALVQDGRRVTYAALDLHARTIAAYLADCGLERGAPLVLCARTAVESIATIWAVWKLGAYYVPVDPGVTAERLETLVNDVGAAIVVCEEQAVAAARKVGARVVQLDTADAPWSASEPLSSDDGGSLDSTAYAIFTSGSTGMPKGVAVAQRSILNLANAHEYRLYRGRVREHARVGLNAPLIFDGSVERLMLLLRGHELHVFSEEMRHDPLQMSAYIASARLEVLDFTPTHLNTLLQVADLATFGPSVRLVLVGGEAVSPNLWRRLARCSFSVFNVYGPTECTVNSTVAPIIESSHGPTIGTALANVAIYIVDDRGRLVPDGMLGEIVVAGLGVAQGYVNRPNLTRERFQYLPLGSTGETIRVYRTGDRGRYALGGGLEYHGRNDRQVKLRGFRIEPGEIEARLTTMDEVAAAVVTLWAERGGEPELVAYLVPVGDARATPQELRSRLESVLPRYMLPSAFTWVDEIPIGPSGKLDMRRLPEPRVWAGQAEGAEGLRKPATKTERTVAQIWAEVLGIPAPHVGTHFFESGGSSLQAMLLLARLKKAFDVDLTARSIFDWPTIGQLSEHLDSAVDKTSEKTSA